MRGSYYDVLGVPPSSTEDEIRARYLRLIRLHHPDRNRSPQAHVRAAAINEAFRHLSDAELRAGHDAQLAGKRQAVVTARAIDFSRDGGRALVVRRRPRKRLAQRYAARLALAALIFATGIAGWQIERRLFEANRASFAPDADNTNDEGRRAVAELLAASAREAQDMPPVSRAVVAQGASAFRRLAARDLAQAPSFSERCHAQAADDGGWDALDFCVAFDQAAYMREMATSQSTDDGFFVDRHDRAAHFYVSKVSSMDTIDERLAQIEARLAAGARPARSGTGRVLHGISKRGMQMASAAWQAISPAAQKKPASEPAKDF